LTPSLLPRVASGDPTAVQECIARWGGLVWSLARRGSTSSAEAEDAVQEIFLDLWRSAARFDPRMSSETTFVAMIARRRLIDQKRKSRRMPATEPLADAPTPVEPAAARRVEDSVEASLAAEALAKLRPEQRLVLVLSACHGMTHEEIAETVRMPLGTVKAHARRGLMKVRALLDGEPVALEGARAAGAP
jgi:RNA polymerase sigma-70 factor (ECF subfamily)